MARPREHDDETRDSLLAAAAAILEERGDAALTVRGVADRVGTTTRAIYSLFGSKEGLVRALYRRGFQGLDDELAAVEASDDAIADLHALGLAYRRSALARPDLYDVMFDCPIPEFEPDAADRELAMGTLERLRGAIRRGLDDGELQGDVEERTFQLWGLVHGLVTLELGGVPPDLDVDRVWDGALSSMLDGMGRGG